MRSWASRLAVVVSVGMANGAAGCAGADRSDPLPGPGTCPHPSACGGHLLPEGEGGRSGPPPVRRGGEGPREFRGHLAVKGMSNDDRTLMTRILVRPALWERTPCVLLDENGFEVFPDSPLGADAGALRAEARADAETARRFWGEQPVRVVVDVEGWPLQFDLAGAEARGNGVEREYEARAAAALVGIVEGSEEGWRGARGGVGFWGKVITPATVERRAGGRTPAAYNAGAIGVWRRVGYFSAQVYPMTRLAGSPAGAKKKGYEPLGEWTRHVFEAVGEMRALRERVLEADPARRADPPDVLPCMFGTRLGWRGLFKNQLMTPAEIRTLVRACHEAGADGVLVWQPLRSEQERGEFQRAVEEIEGELAAVRGMTVEEAERMGGRVTLGEWWGIGQDWPGRAMGWMLKQPGARE